MNRPQPLIDETDVDRFFDICDDLHTTWLAVSAIEENHGYLESDNAQIIDFIHSTLNESIVLGIGRLEDKEFYEKKDLTRYNLSIKFFENRENWPPPKKENKGLFSDLHRITESLRENSKHLEDARNRFVAHNDRESHRKGEALGKSTRETYEAYFSLLQEFTSILKREFYGTSEFPFTQNWEIDMKNLLLSASQKP